MELVHVFGRISVVSFSYFDIVLLVLLFCKLVHLRIDYQWAILKLFFQRFVRVWWQILSCNLFLNLAVAIQNNIEMLSIIFLLF